MSVNLGPVRQSLMNGSITSNGNSLSYNPRCLQRVLTDYINQRFNNASSAVNLIINSKDISEFQNTMQAVNMPGEIGVHGGGHDALGGTNRDNFLAAADPAFYLHHGIIDKAWWMWQQRDPKTRIGAQGIFRTTTAFNTPPSANTTIDTPVQVGYIGAPNVTVGDVMSITDGPFCYIYA